MRWPFLNKSIVFKLLLGYFLLTLVVLGGFVVIKVDLMLERREYIKKVAEANSLLGMDAGVIESFGGIKKNRWPEGKEIPDMQDSLRQQFVSILGFKPDYRKNPQIHIHSAQDLGKGIQRRIFTVAAEPGYQIKGCMIVPRGDRPMPSVILAYGLGGTLVDTCGWKVQSYHNDMGLQLAERGYLTVVYILRGMGKDGHDWGRSEWGQMRYKDLVGYALQHGSSAMAIWVHDGIQVLKALRIYPDVVPEKIAVGGISHGGQVALYTGAIVKDEIAAVISMGSFVSFDSLFTEIHNSTGHAIPGIGNVGDMGDIAALVAPRPLLVQWGEKDSIRPGSQLRPSSLAEFERVRKVYEKMNVPQNLRKVISPNKGHEFDVEAAVNFLDAFLM